MLQKFNKSKVIIILSLMTIFMTIIFWQFRDVSFQNDSESLVVGMINAAKYDMDISVKKYGLGFNRFENSKEYSEKISDTYNIYANSELAGNSIIEDYRSQIGLQGWTFYLLTKLKIPSPVFVFRLACCIFLSFIISLICYELYNKYGLLLAAVFYFVSMCSSWLANFSSNLYWVEFTWFIPMLLGLICLNNLNKRFFLYPLFFLAIIIKCACGYEYITVIMLMSIIFFIVEWICMDKKDKQQRKIIFKTILEIGVIQLLSFFAVLFIHAYLRGDGNIFDGLNNIYNQDILRRTFGNIMESSLNLPDSFSVSVFYVLKLYLTYKPEPWISTTTGFISLMLLFALIPVFIYKYIKTRNLLDKEMWLFIFSFISCVSWFIFAKNHSYIHTHMNYVMWYMGYIQISIYILLKFILNLSLIKKTRYLLKKR